VPEAIGRGLTTMAQPSLQKGRRAGELLLKPPRTGLPNQPVVELLGTELSRGRTAGPPA
jgi:DNA-binding LacI/PurR family transcriptional regulator